MANTARNGKSEELARSLKSSDLIVQHYVTKLEAKNAKLQEEIAGLELDNMSTSNKIKALQKERKALQPPKEATTLEAARRIAFLFNQVGFHVVDSEGKKVEP